ncbi:nucleotide sugar dehydrogenase [Azospirillum cavernae]|uniref:UDP-glucose 6-dehydrogenase n=1 Tax=Azospirillum cavernae TaxID=2320860 RepID=A0A418VLE4_9PROT|nr:nucleotide sugar dehydrogenase [Azospirillum cavernae]RJF76869.1 nucleotide sugar dehydrogenase [Azospirillum cavernae]
MTLRIAFAGMTHLGLISGLAAAAKGFSVVCFDPGQERIAALNVGQLPVSEPGLEALRSEVAGRVRFAADPDALRDCQLVYVAPDVPTDAGGGSDLRGLEELLDLVAAHVEPGTPVVLLSQVPPGFTRAHQRPEFALLYQVETLVFGRAVERALAPERIILGLPDGGQPLPPALAAFLDRFDCPQLPMAFESAELAKIAINVCLVASVTVANTLAEVCESIGADWHDIVPALKLDRRIGPHAYLMPGLGIAGGNLERDLATVRELASIHGADARLIDAFIGNSRHRRDWALRVLAQGLGALRDGCKVAVLGLAYKEDTASTKNSAALALIGHLNGLALSVYDPLVSAAAAGLNGAVEATGALEACQGAEAVLLMTPWPAFREIRPAALAEAMVGRLVVDPYGLLDHEDCRAAGLDHRRLGRPLSPETQSC